MSRACSLGLVVGYAVLSLFSVSAFAGNHDHSGSGNQSGDKTDKPPVIVDPIRPKRDVVVRDHRNPRPIVRDHRDTSNSPGGTSVTNTPVIRDHRSSGVFDSIIRDHRRPPVVRDHRDVPVVRDHRTPNGGSIFDPFADKRWPGKIPPTPPVIPIDPGRGDGKVGTPIPIDPGRGDGKVIVRDHRVPPVVRDHRRPPIVRDHRDTSNSSGGTTVTNTPVVRDHRRPVSPVVRDHRDVPVVRDHRTPASPIVRDHRDTSNNSGGISVTNTPVVRDHRSPDSPVVRDHRKPVVRDHR
jgi:hypothetical protein